MVGILRVGRLLAGTSLGSTAFTPASLFAASEPGGWYDPSDLTTLFQDASGTTLVTAVEQPEGLVLDKSRGLVLGSELVTNGDFSNGTTGWSSFAIAGTSSLSIVNGSLRVTTSVSTGDSGARQVITGLTAGVTYRVSILSAVVADNNVADVVGSVRWANGNVTSGYTRLSTPTKSSSLNPCSGHLTPSGTTITLFLVNSGSGSSSSTYTIDYDNISVRELPGNHLSQSSAAARPVLSATSRIDYDGTDDKMTAASSGGGTTGFLFVAGINLDAIGATQTIWSDTGTNTGYRVRVNSSNQLELAAGNGTAYTTAVTTETLSATTNYVIAAWHDGTNLNVKLGTGGAVASQAFAAASAGSSGFTIGMDNGAVSSQLNGKLYNVVYVKNFAGSLSDVTNTIAYVNGTLT